MKILYTTHQFLPDYSAGTEIITYQTAKEMKKRGNDVHIFTGYPAKGPVSESASFDHYEYEGISVDRFYHSNRHSLLPGNPMEAEYNNLFFAGYFRGWLERSRPDIVHFYHLQRLSASAIDICAELKIPIIFTATDYWCVCPLNQLLLPDSLLCSGPDKHSVNCLRHMVSISHGRAVHSILKIFPDWIVAVLIRLARGTGGDTRRLISLVRALAARPEHMKKSMNKLNMVLVATRFMADLLEVHGLNPERIQLLGFGIKHDLCRSNPEKGTRTSLRIGFIGTLYPHKGAHVLLEAVRSLPPDLPLEVKIYGSRSQFPEYSGSLRSMAGNDQRIWFRGTFPHSGIGEVLNGLDVLVVPSLWYENSPLVVHSAQEAGVPVVASDVGGLNEVITRGEDGLLFEAGDATGLAQIIRMLCDDRSRVAYLSGHTRRPKSIATYVDELEEIYKDVMSNAGI